MSNITLKQLPHIPEAPLKYVGSGTQNLVETFQAIRRQMPYSFVDNDSPHLTICGLTPQVSVQYLQNVCAEYGTIKAIQLRAYYLEYVGHIVAHVSYESAAEAKLAFNELSMKIESGFDFKIFYGGPVFDVGDICRIKIPNSNIRPIIDRLAKIVVQEGFGLEECLKAKQIHNPEFAFLFIECHEHQYYKWRIYSLLNGDSEKQWRTDCYQVSIKGKVYYPPPVDFDDSNGSSSLVKKEFEKAQLILDKSKDKKQTGTGQQTLNLEDRLQLNNLIRELNTQKIPIGRVMMFCMDHAACSCDIVLTIMDSLIGQATWVQKLCRLYLISDILHNSGAASPNYWSYKLYFQQCLPTIFDNLIELLPFKEKVIKLIGIWREWGIFDVKYLKGLEVTFSVRVNDVDCSASHLYKDSLMRANPETLERICRSKGLPTKDKDDMIQRLLKYKFYHKSTLNKVQVEQVLKAIPVYKNLVDKDQQSIVQHQRQSFSLQIQQLQELLKLLKKRCIVNDTDGEVIDEIDEKLYEFPKHMEHQKIERQYYTQMDGVELTKEDEQAIQNKKVQIVTYYPLEEESTQQIIQQQPVLDVIEIEVNKYKDVLKALSVYSPNRIDDFARAKRALLNRIDQLRKDHDKAKQDQLNRDKDKERELEKERVNKYSNRDYKDKDKDRYKTQQYRKSSSSSDRHKKRDRKRNENRRRSRSDSHKRTKSRKQ